MNVQSCRPVDSPLLVILTQSDASGLRNVKGRMVSSPGLREQMRTPVLMLVGRTAECTRRMPSERLPSACPYLLRSPLPRTAMASTIPETIAALPMVASAQASRASTAFAWHLAAQAMCNLPTLTHVLPSLGSMCAWSDCWRNRCASAVRCSNYASAAILTPPSAGVGRTRRGMQERSWKSPS